MRIAAMTAAALALGLAACGNPPETETETPDIEGAPSDPDAPAIENAEDALAPPLDTAGDGGNVMDNAIMEEGT